MARTATAKRESQLADAFEAEDIEREATQRRAKAESRARETLEREERSQLWQAHREAQVAILEDARAKACQHFDATDAFLRQAGASYQEFCGEMERIRCALNEVDNRIADVDSRVSAARGHIRGVLNFANLADRLGLPSGNPSPHSPELDRVIRGWIAMAKRSEGV